MKKLAIIGRGTAGCYAIAYFLKSTNWNIDWYFDPNVAPQSVGEGSTVEFPTNLDQFLGFKLPQLDSVDGTFKAGIKKQGWGSGKEYYHLFPSGTVAYHFNAVKLQEWIINYAGSQSRVKIINNNIKAYNDIDSDFVLDCSGRPSENELQHFHLPQTIPVNAVHVTQCYWDIPRFQYSLNIAKKHGWVFGIPLQNRCSIGYLYNHKINTIDEVKEDVQSIFDQYGLTPSETTNSFTFNNYYRKQNFYGRVAFNGNASFFLEPLEATSIACMNVVNVMAHRHWTGRSENSNKVYYDYINRLEDMIMLHYYKNDMYDSDFWKFATERGQTRIKETIRKQNIFRSVIKYAIDDSDINPLLEGYGYGTWGQISYTANIKGMGLAQDLSPLIQ